jgi:predicted enzyme involved in methoxymalonyl-ACP biosynthesis
VGFSLVSRRAQEVRIEDFMLSCRVQGRFVEQAFFNAMVEGEPAVQRIVVNFTATGRNTPARQVLLAMEFAEVSEESLMQLDPRKRKLTCDFIQVDREIAVEPRESIAATST